MKRYLLWAAALSTLLMLSAAVNAEKTIDKTAFTGKVMMTDTFPRLGDRSANVEVYRSTLNAESNLRPALWPFGRKDEGESASKPKSARKAFFLSLILPGLGETYVGSKRGIFFLGAEAVAWWMYISYSNKGYDIEDEFRAFADSHWHYYDETLDYDYWRWVENNYIEDENIGPEDYDEIKKILEDEGAGHHYSGRNDQQDYEMIGKYPQFLYGWEDLEEHNQEIRQDGKIIYLDLKDLKGRTTPFREEYEDMRYDSNKKLKLGQRGIHIMLINRVLSAIDAGRLAYHHNKKLESELSSIQIRVVQKKIIDNRVPMIILTKKF